MRDAVSLNRQLVDTIKTSFIRRSTAHLETVAAGEADRWSPEAVVAAGEVLQERLAGDAAEPDSPDDDDDQFEPPSHYEPDELALGLLAGLMCGHLVIPYYTRSEPQDVPIPFGPKMAWLAMETTDTTAAATALGLVGVDVVTPKNSHGVTSARWQGSAFRGVVDATWGKGIEAAHRGAVFVTPPVGDWTLAVGTPLFPRPGREQTLLVPFLERVGRTFPEAQYFCNHRDVNLLIWARARGGRVDRAYGWLGALDGSCWEIGEPTTEEQNLGLLLTEGRPPQIDAGSEAGPEPLSEEWLFQLAGHWSVDPTQLGIDLAEPLSGLLGTIEM